MDAVAATTFSQWSNLSYSLNNSKKNCVIVGKESATWEQILNKASCLAKQIIKPDLYIIDPHNGIQSIIALAAAILADCSFLWANPKSINFSIEKHCESIYVAPPLHENYAVSDRTYYGTLTSGSSSAAKIAMGFSDQLILIGNHYSHALYDHSLYSDGIISSCLPMEYSASFMMTILPALMSFRQLILFRPDDWRLILSLAEKQHVTVVIAPSMLTSACAFVRDQYFSDRLTFLTTAGYLSTERVRETKKKYPYVKFEVSYGSTETGIMTLAEFSEENKSVGKPLLGKPIWLRNVDDNGIGNITTSGPDCREFYLNNGKEIRNQDGTVDNIDYGYFDDLGNLYLNGRIDDALKINGMLIYPKVIEQFLLTLEGVLDVKVQIDEKFLGSAFIEAIIIGNVSKDNLIKHCERLDHHLRPNAYKIYKDDVHIYSDRGKIKELNNGKIE